MHQLPRNAGMRIPLSRLTVCAACVVAALMGNTAALGQEKRIADVRIEGTKIVSVDEVKEKISIKPGDVYDAGAVERDRQSILAIGRFTEVRAAEEDTPDGVVVTFAVTERRLIAEIEIVGTKTISRDVVAAEIEDANVKVGDEYDARAIETARQNIRAQPWYTDVTVRTEETPAGTRVRFIVQEKERIRQIRFVGNTVVTDEELLEQMVLQPGMIADTATIRADMVRIKSYYQRRGYDASVVNTNLAFEQLEIYISERRIKEIRVNGLRKTKRSVVTREMRIKEGNLFNENDVTHDLRRILNLQIFDNIAWDLRNDPVDPDKYVILIITVKEKRTGTVGFGGGFTSVDGLVGRVHFTENNLFGGAKKATLLGEFGGRTSFMVSYTDPWLDRKRTSLSVSVFDIERRRRLVGGGGFLVRRDGTTFDERRAGGSVSVGRRIAPDLNVLVGIRAEDISEAFFSASRQLGDLGFDDFPGAVRPASDSGAARQVGGGIPPGGSPGPIVIGAPLHEGGELRSVSLTTIYDRRDLYDNPTGGFRIGASAESAGSFIGGGTDFRKFSGDVRYYKKISESKERVLAARVKAGITSGDLPIFEAFIVGGSDSLRGYREDRFWGRRMLLFNVELREPITDSLTAVAFVDAGSAWGGGFKTGLPGFTVQAPDDELSMRASVGAGVRVQTPFGPLRFDFGQGQEGGEFHFGFGHIF